MKTLKLLEFEQPLQNIIHSLEQWEQLPTETRSAEEGARLRREEEALIRSIYAKLSPWQISLLSRHPQRPYTLDYIGQIFTEFHEMHGDRSYADDPAIVGGLARLEGKPCMVIGHQKGRDIKERTHRNFGMPRPEGYRKARRLMETAEKFRLPLFTLIDTPGAYPGIGAEERGQSEAIGHNIYTMVQLKIPIIVTIIGEGGSGGALAMAVGDHVMMMQYSTYSVISPEGCASILWKDSSRAPEAASALGITAERLSELGLIDQIIPEPLGGAQRNSNQAGLALKTSLLEAWRTLSAYSTEDLLQRRYDRLMQYGRFTDTPLPPIAGHALFPSPSLEGEGSR